MPPVRKRPERKRYALLENPDWETGYKIFTFYGGNLEAQLEGIPYKEVVRAGDIEEGDEVVVWHKGEGKVVHGVGEVTSVDYSQRKPFSVFFSDMATNPGECFRALHGDIMYKVKTANN